jgi:hypothetical protein
MKPWRRPKATKARSASKEEEEELLVGALLLVVCSVSSANAMTTAQASVRTLRPVIRGLRPHGYRNRLPQQWFLRSNRRADVQTCTCLPGCSFIAVTNSYNINSKFQYGISASCCISILYTRQHISVTMQLFIILYFPFHNMLRPQPVIIRCLTLPKLLYCIECHSLHMFHNF